MLILTNHNNGNTLSRKLFLSQTTPDTKEIHGQGDEILSRPLGRVAQGILIYHGFGGIHIIFQEEGNQYMKVVPNPKCSFSGLSEYFDCPWLKIGDNRRVYPYLECNKFRVELGLYDRPNGNPLMTQYVFSGTSAQQVPITHPWRDGPYFKQQISVLVHNDNKLGRNDVIHRIFTYEI